MFQNIPSNQQVISGSKTLKLFFKGLKKEKG